MRRLAVLMTLALSSPALAAPANDKPDIGITNRSSVVTVTIEAPLKRHPGLAADLLAEGKRFVARSQAEAAAEYNTNREWFTDGRRARRWTYERVYHFRSLAGGRYVSIVRDDGTYTGGAHPNTRIDTILWDAAAKKRISIRPFFTEMADNGPAMTALAQAARHAVAAKKFNRWKDSRPDDEKKNMTGEAEEIAGHEKALAETIRPQLLKLGPVTLAPSTVAGKSSGLTVHYSPYDVDAYAAGPYTVFVPWTAFRAHLSAEGAALFGGERPKGDAEER